MANINNSQNLSDDTNSMLSANSSLNVGHSTLAGNIRIGRVNFQRRTAEGSRLLRENFQTVIQEFRPFVEQARTVNQSGISLSTLLNRQQSRNDSPSTPTDVGDSFVINLGDSSQGQVTSQQLLNTGNVTHIHTHNHAADNILNNIREASASIEHNTNNNNNNPEETHPAEALRQVPEARALLEILQRYVPFLLILLGKGLYDHGNGILNFIILFGTFSHSNSVVKREACKQHRRSLTALLMQVFYILCGIFFIGYIFQDGYNLFSNLIFIPSYTQPPNMWDLIWTVGITDFLLKLITILFKIVIVAIPAQLLPYQKRGKYYLLTEATSQLYRSIAPIQPWLYYFLESYQGPEKVASVFLSAAYMVSKGSDLVARMRLFKSAVFKVFQNVSLGSSPNKEQLQSAGSQCPICHDDYDTPVLLQCRHIFCESCVSTWFDREQTCPLCRAKVVDDPSWRDGSTTYFTQLF